MSAALVGLDPDEQLRVFREEDMLHASRVVDSEQVAARRDEGVDLRRDVGPLLLVVDFVCDAVHGHVCCEGHTRIVPSQRKRERVPNV